MERRQNTAARELLERLLEDRHLIDQSELERRLAVERATAYASGYSDGFAAGLEQQPRTDELTAA